MMKKKILVTGSSRGIGYSLAESLLEDGHNVVFTGRNKKVFEKLRKKNKKINFVVGDFSKPKDAKKTVERAIKILKGLDVLICNVGESKSCPPNKEFFNDG